MPTTNTILTEIPFKLDLPALMKANRIREGSPHAAEFAALCEQAQQAGRPKAVYRLAYIDARQGDRLTLDGVTFTSRMLARNLEAVERAFAFVVTCGAELEDLPEAQGDLLKSFWWDAIKEAVLREAYGYLVETLARTYRLEKTAVMHPGSADADVWPIEQQRDLFQLLDGGPASIGVRLSETFLMWPVKTISGVLFATQSDFQSCQVCQREDCPGRRASFDPALWQAAHSA
jgi:hypothetical protein